MLIGQLARRTGVPTSAIRFYEQHDLISVAPRSSGGYRVYGEQAVSEIAFIKAAQRIGFALDEIRDILKLGRGGRMPCARVVHACETHLADIDRRMKELKAFRVRFQRTLQLAERGCGLSAEGYCNAILAAK